jgi:hypothetical protein
MPAFQQMQDPDPPDNPLKIGLYERRVFVIEIGSDNPFGRRGIMR